MQQSEAPGDVLTRSWADCPLPQVVDHIWMPYHAPLRLDQPIWKRALGNGAGKPQRIAEQGCLSALPWISFGRWPTSCSSTWQEGLCLVPWIRAGARCIGGRPHSRDAARAHRQAGCICGDCGIWPMRHRRQRIGRRCRGRSMRQLAALDASLRDTSRLEADVLARLGWLSWPGFRHRVQASGHPLRTAASPWPMDGGDRDIATLLPVESSCDVLVVGAGPTGMLLACELARHGLRVRLIDAGRSSTPWSKAQVLHARTLEILEQMGIVAPFLERGKPLHTLSMYDRDMKRLFHFDIGEPDSRYPYMLSLSQHDTEVLLIEQLERMGIAIERLLRLSELHQDAHGVRAVVRHAERTENEEILRGLAGRLRWCAQHRSPPAGAVVSRQHLSATCATGRCAHRLAAAPCGRSSDRLCVGHGPIGANLPETSLYRLMAFDAGMGPTLKTFSSCSVRGPAGSPRQTNRCG